MRAQHTQLEPPGQTAADTAALPRRPFARRLAGHLAVALTVAGIVGLGAGGIALLHLKANAEPVRAPFPPITVETFQTTPERSYQRTVTYTGRLEAARQTQLAFERGGLVIAVVREEGQSVQAGDVVARLDTSELQAARRQLEARKRELEAQHELARLNLKRQNSLKRGGWSPEQRFDEARASLARLTAAVAQVEAELDGNRIALEKSQLKAPFAGVVGRRTIHEGTVVAPGTALLTLIETGRLKARIGLPPHVADALDAGSTHTLRMDRASLTARLDALRPDLATGTRTVTAIFEVAGGGVPIRIGDLVTLAASETVREHGTWVPVAALREGRRGLWTVMVVDETDTAAAVVQPEAVELLYAQADRAYVRGTLRPGARIVANGTNRVVSGQRVALAGGQPK